MSRWSIGETRERIVARFPKAQLEGEDLCDFVAPSLQAMAERQNYALYHYQEVRRLLKEFQDKHLIGVPLMVVSHGADETKRGDYEVFMIRIGAHLVACVLSIHALADTTAFAAYHALGYGLRSDAVPLSKLHATTVRDRLKSEPKHAPIATVIDTFLSDRNYQHVAALANRSKHRALVRPTLSEDWSGQRPERHEIRFAAFRTAARRFPEVEVSTLLAPAYELASRSVVDTGNGLLAALA
jgi:hypothetical protein